MNSCKIIQIQTPDKFLLNGLWFGPEKAETVFVYVHGLSGSAFGHHDLSEKISQRKNTAVLSFNNKGSVIITRIKRLNLKKAKGYDSHMMGQVHEVFTDCVDDIEGAVNFAKENGAKNIYLIGHSTGCQKSVYYLSKKQKTPVKGVILLAPLSDYASAVALVEPKLLEEGVKTAKEMIEQGKSHELMPSDLCYGLCDAQRFLSLNTPESIEEIFSYAVPEKKPLVLKKVKVPVFAVIGTNDEYLDRSATEVMNWFQNTLIKQKASFELVEGAPHNFKGFTEKLDKIIGDWVSL